VLSVNAQFVDLFIVTSSSCARAYYLAANPEVQRKLQAELDDALGSVRSAPSPAGTSGLPPLPPWASVAKYADIKSMPYLQACIQEGMRLHSALGVSLPRIVPEGSILEVCGQTFSGGTITSVPSYSIHHNEELWGLDSEVFRHERRLG
jgi:benzoate 4-monooxygenase